MYFSYSFRRYVRLKNQAKRNILRDKNTVKTFQVRPAFLYVKAKAPKWRRAASSDTSLADISVDKNRNNISNIWIYLGLRLDFRLRVYMLKASKHRPCFYITFWTLLYVYNTFIRHFFDICRLSSLDFLVSSLDFLVSTLDFFSRLSTLDFWLHSI